MIPDVSVRLSAQSTAGGPKKGKITVQINHQPDTTIFQFIILTFIYRSTGFGRFPAHHQELNDCSNSL
jgi:hypothetical protein